MQLLPKGVPLRQTSENTVAVLRDLILTGDLEPGSRLGEADLATRLQVSRTPIREALPRLAAEGLVELIPNRGARVVSWSTEDLEQIFEIRLRLEPYAVSLAVPRLTDDDLDELQELARHMQELGTRGWSDDLDQVFEMNRAFHGLLIEKAANPALASSLLSVTHASVVNINLRHYGPAAMARSLSHHLEIVAAARAGDPQWAASVMTSHLYNARATMLPADVATQASAVRTATEQPGVTQ